MNQDNSTSNDIVRGFVQPIRKGKSSEMLPLFNNVNFGSSKSCNITIPNSAPIELTLILEPETYLWVFEKYDGTSRLVVNDILVTQRRIYAKSADVFQVGNSKTKFNLFYPTEDVDRIKTLLSKKRPDDVTPGGTTILAPTSKTSEKKSTKTGVETPSQPKTQELISKKSKDDITTTTKVEKPVESDIRPLETRMSLSAPIETEKPIIPPARMSLPSSTASTIKPSRKRKRDDESDSDEAIEGEVSFSHVRKMLKLLEKNCDDGHQLKNQTIAKQATDIYALQSKYDQLKIQYDAVVQENRELQQRISQRLGGNGNGAGKEELNNQYQSQIRPVLPKVDASLNFKQLDDYVEKL